MGGKLTFTQTPARLRIERIKAMLEREPMNVLAIAAALPISKRWALEYIKHMHATKQIHILRWDKEVEERAKRHAIEIWTLGPGEDAPRPEPDGRAVRSKRAWESLKADEDRHELWNAKRRVRRRIKSKRLEPAAAWITSAANNNNFEAAA
jgi:hypothetical protein